jgi:ATP-dependent Clp protease ATP-binding subunit ClpB
VHHGVEISDGALVTGMFTPFNSSLSMIFTLLFLCTLAAVYGARYISDRYLPDKAIDLVDEAASALRLAQESKPDELEALDREIITLQIELESLKKESDVFSLQRRSKLEEDLKARREEAEKMTAVWQAGRPSTHWHVKSTYSKLRCESFYRACQTRQDQEHQAAARRR